MEMQRDYVPGEGWVSFSAVMFVIAGLYNLMAGGIALLNSTYFSTTSLIYGSLSFWGAVWLILGIVELGIGILLFTQSNVGRILGIIVASINAVVWMFLVTISPLWALTIIGIDFLIIYGLTVSGEVFTMNRHMPSSTM